MLGAQAEPYYDGMDDRYDSYEPTYLPNNEDYDYKYTPDEDGKSYYNEEPYSYGDSYSDDMYSEYPTKDKKFECEEGSFTGFLVSDPIFCDVELPAGSQGPPGPPGPRGQTGPAGPNQISPATIYTVSGELVTSENGVPAQSVALCDEGDTVLSGSYILSNVEDVFEVVDAALPTQNGWQTSVTSNEGGEVLISTFAQCFDNPPLRTLATADVSVSQQQSEDSPIISQGIGDSPIISQGIGDLTATEKITKLKQQWMELLP